MHDLLQTGSSAGASAYSTDKILTVWKDKQVIISFTENTAGSVWNYFTRQRNYESGEGF